MTDRQMANRERCGLAVSLLMMAAARNVEALETGDARFTAAAGSIRQIAKSMDQIDDATMLRLSHVDEQSEGLLWQLVAARVEQIAVMLPLYPDAASFFEPITEQVDAILQRARARMH
jgi:hypothetical protein